MGRAERPASDQPANRTRPRDGGDDRGDAGFLVIKGRQQAWYRPGQQRLARSRRPDHEHAVAACQSQLERAAGLQLAADLGQIRFGRRNRPTTRGTGSHRASRPRRTRSARPQRGRTWEAPRGPCLVAGAQECGRLGQRCCRHDFDTLGKGGFHRAGCRHDHSSNASSARAATIGSSPGTGRSSPPSDSSPRTAHRPAAVTCSEPTIIPSAIARSSDAPPLRRSAGAR